jgi:hypothetical protein
MKTVKRWCDNSLEYDASLTFNACSGNYDLNVTKTASAPSTINITGNIAAYCPGNMTTHFKPSGIVYLYEQGGCYRSIYAYMNRGQISVNNIKVGATYRAYFYYDRIWHKRTFVASADKLKYDLIAEIQGGSVCK